MLLYVTLLGLHLLAAVYWVGGMAFAYMVLRPSAGELEPPVRLALWRRVFERFFPVVGGAIVLLLVTGLWMIADVFGGFSGLALYINLMMAIGIIMMLIFFHLVMAPWKRFKAAVDGSDWPAAARQLGQIRMIVGINLILGVITVVIGGTGHFW